MTKQNFQKKLTKCRSYILEQKQLPNIKYHVFISKHASQELSDISMNENWGKNNVLLYKYLDYMWRLQLIDESVKIFDYFGKPRLIYNTGLKQKIDSESIYLCLVPNETFCNHTRLNTQKWRIACNKGFGRNKSFVTKHDLMRLYRIHKDDIPKETVFAGALNKFDPKYTFVIDLQERIRTTKERIINQIKKDTGYSGSITTEDLTTMLNESIQNTIDAARLNPNISIQQVFIERDLVNNKKKTNGYHLEMLLPLTLKFKDNKTYFSLVLRSNHGLKEYEGMSIITREMAYNNSRLVGPVNVSWLKPFANTNKLHGNISEADIEFVAPASKTVNKVDKELTLTEFEGEFDSDSLAKKLQKNDTLYFNENLLANIDVTNGLNGLLFNNNKLTFNNYYDNPFIYIATVLPLKLPTKQLNTM